jgi:hypothetical protein
LTHRAVKLRELNDSTSKDNKVLLGKCRTCRSGMMATRQPRSASCGSKDNEAPACRRAFRNAAGLYVFRKAYEWAVNDPKESAECHQRVKPKLIER